MTKITTEYIRGLIREELLIENKFQLTENKFQKIIQRLNKVRNNTYRITSDNKGKYWVINKKDAPVTPQLSLDKLYIWLDRLVAQLEMMGD